MGAPTGNQFWKLRSEHGRDKLFATPSLMWDAACEYFQWCEDNPYYEVEQKKGNTNVRLEAGVSADGISDILDELRDSTIDLPKIRPFTMHGLCLYLDCNTGYFNDFKDGLKGKDDSLSKDFSLVVTRIQETVYNQKFSGAAVGFFNASIIASDLGLRNKSDITTNGEKLESKTVIQWGDKQIPI